MLSEKEWAEQLNKKNQKQHQKIVGKLLYYARAIDPKMLAALKFLATVQTKPTIENTKNITRFLNYSASYPDEVTEYIRSGIILHIYLDVSYISEPEAWSIAGGYFFLGPNSTTPIKLMPPEIGTVHLEFGIIRNVMESSTEA